MVIIQIIKIIVQKTMINMIVMIGYDFLKGCDYLKRMLN